MSFIEHGHFIIIEAVMSGVGTLPGSMHAKFKARIFSYFGAVSI